jgi:hypothetical protein
MSTIGRGQIRTEERDGVLAPRLRELVLLWFAFLAPPVGWFIGFNADYALVRVACTEGTVVLLHLVTVGTLALAASGGLAAWRRLEDQTPEGIDGPGGASRRHFMAMIGVMASAFFILLILAQWVTKLFLDPCMGA